MKVTTSSGTFSLDLRDLLRGLMVAVFSAIIAFLYEYLNAGNGLESIEWMTLVKVAVLSALSYLLKNLFTPGEVVIEQVPKETLTQVSKGELTAKIVENPRL